MFIESPRYTERFGSVRMNHVQKVVALDSGLKSELPPHGAMGVIKIDEEIIKYFEDRMAIVIPVKDEKLKLFEGGRSLVPSPPAKITAFIDFAAHSILLKPCLGQNL